MSSGRPERDGASGAPQAHNRSSGSSASGATGEGVEGRPIVLVGLMGSGKSWVGRRLATDLERPFVDTDDEVERRAGKAIAAIFADDGEPAFRDLEREVLTDVLAADPPAVVATGGGIVLDARNRAALGGARVVFLHATPGTLANRVGEDGTRPLLGDDPLASLTRLAAERDELYRSVADRVVEVGHRTRRQAVDDVLAALGLPVAAGTGAARSGAGSEGP
jgi:shikimate kinase